MLCPFLEPDTVFMHTFASLSCTGHGLLVVTEPFALRHSCTNKPRFEIEFQQKLGFVYSAYCSIYGTGGYLET